MTYCLAHTLDGKPNGCCLSDECPAHLAIRYQIINKDEHIYDRICGEYPVISDPEKES